jgi:hypothetical protein
MNKRIEWCTLFLVDVVMCTGVLAVGDPHSQGTLLAGTGLDWQRSGTLLQAPREVTPPVASDAIPYLLPAAAGKKPFTVNRASLEFTGKCDQISDVVMRCEVSAKSGVAGPDSQLCGYWLGKAPTVWVYLINGRPSPSGMFSFGSPGNEGAFVACSVTDPKHPDEWEWKSLGAVGKCLLWDRGANGLGWVPTAKDKQLEFNACLRAVRADYCGTGVTHTIDGTHIDLYGVTEAHEIKAPYLLEATWNERGAVCLIHARWLVLSPGCQAQFSRVLGRPPPSGGDSKEAKKSMPKDSKGGSPKAWYTGTEYHCDMSQLTFLGGKLRCEDEPGLITKALRSGILADDSLLE